MERNAPALPGAHNTSGHRVSGRVRALEKAQRSPGGAGLWSCMRAGRSRDGRKSRRTAGGSTEPLPVNAKISAQTSYWEKVLTPWRVVEELN